MLAIQSGIAKIHCLYARGAVASQTPGVFFDSPGRPKIKLIIIIILYDDIPSVQKEDLKRNINKLAK